MVFTPKDMPDRAELAAELRQSELLQAEACARALEDTTYDFAPYNGPGAGAADLISIYQARVARLDGIGSSHADDLAACARELIENLERGPMTSVAIHRLQGSSEHSFMIFAAEGSGEILGCFKSIAKQAVSQERWSDLWQETAPRRPNRT